MVAVSSVWLVRVWQRPTALPRLEEKKSANTVNLHARNTLPSSAYDIIADRDMFRPNRMRLVVLNSKPRVVPKTVQPPQVQAPPPPPKPVPKLNLIGTVLLNDSKAAIIENIGAGQRANYYKIGDSIEGFVIGDIQKESVMLMRGSETMNIVMNQMSSNQPDYSAQRPSATSFFKTGKQPAYIPPGQMRRGAKTMPK